MSDSENEIDAVEEDVKKSSSKQGDKIPQSQQELLMWALEHSSGQQVDKSQLLQPEEFQKMMKQMFPDQISILKKNVEKLKQKDLSDQEIHDCLDTIAKIATPMQQANWLADLGGYELIVDFLKNPNPETRRGAGMIISLCSQNNHQVQLKYNKSPGIKKTLESLTGETDVKIARQKLVMISCLLRGCVENRIDFYRNEGFRYLLDYCQKWPQLWQSFAFMIVAILEEDNPNDSQEMNKVGLRIICIQNRHNIQKDELLKIIITKLL